MLIGGGNLHVCVSIFNFALTNYKTLHLNRALAKTGK